MRTAAKVDESQQSIVSALRDAGICVSLTNAVGGGFPDAVLSHSGRMCCAEFKTGKRKLNEKQRKFREGFEGHIIVTNDPADAVDKFWAWIDRNGP